jgi:hypothetical protein
VAVLTNSGTEPITISTRLAVTGVLALEGVIVGESLDACDGLQTIELAPGEGLELPLRVSTTVCDTGAAVQAGSASVVVALEVSFASTGESFVLVASPATINLD